MDLMGSIAVVTVKATRSIMKTHFTKSTWKTYSVITNNVDHGR